VSAPVSVLVHGGGKQVDADVRAALARRPAYVETVTDGRQGLALCRRCHFDVIVLAGGEDALGWWETARQEGLVSRAVLIVDQIDAALLLRALRLGVEDVFEIPLDGRALAARILDRPGNGREEPRAADEAGVPALIGDCPAMQELTSLVARIAPLPAPVLIEGEAGTGKATVAEAIHALSGRPGPFAALDCETIAPELLESELFGPAPGTGSGVRPDRQGLLVAARTGTLFLRAIGNLPPATQGKLARVLDKGAMRPAGGEGMIPVDIRVVASSREHLRGRVQEDLFYALSVIRLRLPPLRQRGADVLRLAEVFGAAAAARAGVAPPVLSAAEQERMLAHSWPGNVRELKNTIERVTLVGRARSDEPEAPARPEQAVHSGYPPDWTLEDVKIDHMRRVVEACGGNKSEAARRLAVSRKTLDRKLPGP
jgi:DNA-binding NtrC family response regulator